MIRFCLTDGYYYGEVYFYKEVLSICLYDFDFKRLKDNAINGWD